MFQFLNDVAAHEGIRSEGYFYFLTSDDTTIPTSESMNLLSLRKPFLSYAHLESELGGAVLIPDPHFIINNGYSKVLEFVKHASSFENRSSRVFWRGADTGVARSCLSLPRVKICERTRGMPWCDIKLSQVDTHCNDTRSLLYSRGVVEKHAPEEAWLKHRGILDIDGYVNAWGLIWRLGSGSVVFRVESVFTNAYIRQLVPWTHYIPISPDLSDLSTHTGLIACSNATTVNLLARIARRAKRLSAQFTYEKEVARVAANLNRIWSAQGDD